MKISIKPNAEVIAAAVELTRQPEVTLARTVIVQIADIERRSALQMRHGLNEEHIEHDLRPKIRDGVTLKPIRLVRLIDGTLLLVDGFHRIEAYSREDILGIEAEIIDGDEERALDEAMAANDDHGLPLTNEDKARKLQIMVGKYEAELRDGTMSYQELARRTRLSLTFVHKHVSAMGVSPDDVRWVKRGDSVYPMKVKEIGKKRTVSNSGEFSPKSEPAITIRLTLTLAQQLRWLAQEFEPGDLKDYLLGQLPEGQ